MQRGQLKNCIRASEAFPSFRLDADDSGVANLSHSLTINSITVVPTFRYIGGDANDTNWTADGQGETLTAAGSGGSFNDGSPFLGADDDSVNPDGTRYWQASGNDFADVATEDMVFECVFKFDSDTAYMMAKIDTAGWVVYSTGGYLYLYLDAGGTAGQVCNTTALTDGVWYHAICFLDRSGSAQWYLNGAVSGAAGDATAYAASLSDNTASFKIAANAAGALIYDQNIAYLALWKRNNWLDTHLQADLAQERFQRLVGLYPELAKGTANWNTYTRATTAYLDKIETGAELLPQPIDLSHGDWTKTRCSVSAATGVETPDGVQAYHLHEDATAANSHYIWDSVSTVSGNVYEYTVDLKQNNRSWVMLYRVNNVEGISFNLATGATGAGFSSPYKYAIESLGNGWYRGKLWFIATAATEEIRIYVAQSDNGFTLDGLDQDSLYIANASVKEWDRKLYLMGAGAPRLCFRKEETSGADFKGYLPETAATNLCTDSEDFTAAAWTKTRATCSGNLVVAPNDTTTADGLYEDATAANSHLIGDGFTQAASTAYVFSIWGKAANRDFMRLGIHSATDGWAQADFDLSTGVVGTEAGNDSADIEDWGNGWFRCWIRDTRATAEGASVYVYIAEADNDVTFDGLNQLSLYLWGAQVEAAVDYPTSYIPTSGGTATRNADVLRFDAALHIANSRGTAELDLLAPADYSPGAAFSLINVNDGGAAADNLDVGVDTSGYGTVISAATGGNAGSVTGTTDIIDGDKHTIRGTWKTNNEVLYINDTSEGTPDTSVDIPDDLDRMQVGTDEGGVRQPNVLVNQVKIWKGPRAA